VIVYVGVFGIFVFVSCICVDVFVGIGVFEGVFANVIILFVEVEFIVEIFFEEEQDSSVINNANAIRNAILPY
jgi:hypothetical protein